MKKILLAVVAISSFGAFGKRTNADKVRATIYHKEGRIIICDSDLRPDLADSVPTLRDAVIRELMLLDAQKLKITVSDAEIDRYLSRVQEQLSMDKAGLVQFFAERGFTFEQAKKELEKNLLVENTVEARVKSKAYVPKSEIEKYHKDNPVVFYTLKQAYLPFGANSRALTRSILERDIESGAVLTNMEWVDVGPVDEKDIAPENAHIKNAKVGSVLKITDTDEGISLLHIVSKTEVPLEERIRDISQLLGKDRFEKALAAFYKELLSNAYIYCRDKDDQDSLTLK